MMRAKRSLGIIGVLLVLFVLQQFGALSQIITEFETMPWWGYFVLAGILYSGFKYFTAEDEGIEDVDPQWIEEQGNVYIRRMEEEREERNKEKRRGAM